MCFELSQLVPYCVGLSKIILQTKMPGSAQYAHSIRKELQGVGSRIRNVTDRIPFSELMQICLEVSPYSECKFRHH